MKRLLWACLLSGCVTTGGVAEAPKAAAPLGKEEAAFAQVKARVDGLPKCQPGAEVGALQVRAALCTKMFCDEACCNQCTWEASLDGMSGTLPVDAAQVRAVLGLPERALECEVAAWARALQGQSLQLEPAACAVR